MSNDLRVPRGRTLSLIVGVTDGDGNNYTLKSDEKLIFGVKLNTESTECIIKKTKTIMIILKRNTLIDP